MDTTGNPSSSKGNPTSSEYFTDSSALASTRVLRDRSTRKHAHGCSCCHENSPSSPATPMDKGKRKAPDTPPVSPPPSPMSSSRKKRGDKRTEEMGTLSSSSQAGEAAPAAASTPSPAPASAPPPAAPPGAGSTKLSCPVCGTTFKTPGLLCKHLRSQHHSFRFDIVPANIFFCIACNEYCTGQADHYKHCKNPTASSVPCDKLRQSLTPATDTNMNSLKTGMLPTSQYVAINSANAARAMPILSTLCDGLTVSLHGKIAGDTVTYFFHLMAFLLMLTHIPRDASPPTHVAGETPGSTEFVPPEITKEYASSVWSTTCARWLSGHGPDDFHQEVEQLNDHRHDVDWKPTSEESTWIRAALEVSNGGLSRGMSQLESLGVAPPTDETLAKVRALHPSPPEEEKAACVQEVAALRTALSDKIGNFEDWIPFDVDAVLKAIETMRLDGAADLCGLRVGHLRLLVHCGFGKTVHALLVAAVRDTLPPVLCSYFWAGRVLPLIKNASNDLRPITIPSLWNRLLGNIYTTTLVKELPPKLQPLQIGVSTSNGIEVNALLTQTALVEDPSLCYVAFDIVNAFNSIFRSCVFKVVRESGNAPLMAYVLGAYGNATECLFRGSRPAQDATVLCSMGVRQGDCLSSLLFAMAFQPVLLRLAAPTNQPPPVLTSGYLDDAGQVDRKPAAKALVNGGFQSLLDEEKTGLTVNKRKTVVYCPGEDLTQEKDEWECTVRSPLEGVIALGVPIGSPTFISDHVMQKALSMKSSLEKLLRLPSQHALLLLRYCVVSKLNHLFRTCPSLLCVQAAKVFDDNIWEIVRKLLDVPDDPECAQLGWDLVRARAALSLPLRMGGCGIAPSSLVLPSAFAAGTRAAVCAAGVLRPDWLPRIKAWLYSAPATSCVIDTEVFRSSLNGALASIKAAYEESIGAYKKVPTPQTLREVIYPFTLNELFNSPVQMQKSATLLLQSIELEKFFGTLQQSQRASLLSRASPHALDFFRAIPSSRALYIPSHVMRYALRRMAFLPVSNNALLPSPNGAHRLPLGDSDASDRSLLRDKYSTSAYPRHTSMIQQIMRMLRAFGLHCTLEPEVPNTDKRGDLRVFGRVITILDFSGVSNLCAQSLPRAATTPGFVADIAFKNKNTKYSKDCENAGAVFLAMIMEEDGLFHKAFLDYVKSITNRAPDFPFAVPEFTTWAAPNPMAYWMQVFSITFLKGNADMWQSAVDKRSARFWRNERAPFPQVADQLFRPSATV